MTLQTKLRLPGAQERSPAVDEDALGPGKDLSKNGLNIIDASSEDLGKDLDDATEQSKRAELLARNGKLLEISDISSFMQSEDSLGSRKRLVIIV